MNLKQLANKLGLSPTTVSRALNGYNDVSQATRERVEAAAAKYDYRASHYASKLASGRSMSIGHVITTGDHMMINPHFSDYIAGASEVYAARGFDLLMTRVRPENSHSQAAEEALYKELVRSKKVDGLVIQVPVFEDFRIPLLQSLGVPFVVHGRSDGDTSSYNLVDVNNRRAFERATDYLLDLGHERIALINGISEMNFAYRRLLGYKNALNRRNIDIDESLIFESEMIEPYGYETTQMLLRRQSPPSAMVVSSILPALGAVRAIQEQGLRIGDDISLIVFDDKLSFLENKGEFPLFTSLRSPIAEAGKMTANLLIDQIENPDQPPKQIIYDAEFLMGHSTKRFDAMSAFARTGKV